MMAEVVRYEGSKSVVRYVQGAPRCGDFCDTCGDCLHCYAEAGYEPCMDGHRWVLYEDMDAERIAELEALTPNG